MARAVGVHKNTIKNDLRVIAEFGTELGWKLHRWQAGGRVITHEDDGSKRCDMIASVYQYPSPWRLLIDEIYIQIIRLVEQRKILTTDRKAHMAIASLAISERVGIERFKRLRSKHSHHDTSAPTAIQLEGPEVKALRLTNERLGSDLELMNRLPATQREALADGLCDQFLLALEELKAHGYTPKEEFWRRCEGFKKH
jgi:hypothetical protein